MYRLSLTFLIAACLIGCGGNASSRSAPSIPTGGSGGASGGPSSASIVQVSAAQNAAGVNISVPAPAGTPPNAEDLGVAPLSGAASAFNTGDIIHRGSSMRVVLFGPGLSGSMTVSILGPNDIQISNVAATSATDNTPGVSFTATVASNAALGARTVVLQASNGNVTTFTGGLEVVP